MPDSIDVLAEGSGSPRGAFHEFDVVVAANHIACEGRVIPQGSKGMIVDVGDTGGTFEVEFLSPFHCVATVSAAQIARA